MGLWPSREVRAARQAWADTLEQTYLVVWRATNAALHDHPGTARVELHDGAARTETRFEYHGPGGTAAGAFYDVLDGLASAFAASTAVPAGGARDRLSSVQSVANAEDSSGPEKLEDVASVTGALAGALRTQDRRGLRDLPSRCAALAEGGDSVGRASRLALLVAAVAAADAAGKSRRDRHDLVGAFRDELDALTSESGAQPHLVKSSGLGDTTREGGRRQPHRWAVAARLHRALHR